MLNDKPFSYDWFLNINSMSSSNSRKSNTLYSIVSLPDSILVKSSRSQETAKRATGDIQIEGVGNLLTHIARFFAFFAIVTSVLGVSFSMVDFLGDGFKIVKRTGLKRIGLTLLTFFPPFLFAWINPHIFDTALGIAGGIGEALLNGILPVLLVWSGRYISKLKGHPQLFGGRGGTRGHEFFKDRRRDLLGTFRGLPGAWGCTGGGADFLATRVCKPRRTRAVFSSMPVNLAACSKRSSSM